MMGKNPDQRLPQHKRLYYRGSNTKFSLNPIRNRTCSICNICSYFFDSSLGTIPIDFCKDTVFIISFFYYR